MSPLQLMKRYEAALASQDWKQVEPLLHDAVCVTFSTGTFKGKAAVQGAFERNFQMIEDEEYSISDLSWVYESDSSAACLYSFQWKGIVGGSYKSGSGRGTSVLLKTSGGWKIVVEHLGPNAS